MSGKIKEVPINYYECDVLGFKISTLLILAAGLENAFQQIAIGLDTTKNDLNAGAVKTTIWPLLELCHPDRKEIIGAVNTLDQIGARPKLIAAAMGLLGWKNFYGSRDWTHCDVHKLLQRHGSKKEMGADGTKYNII